MRKIVPDSVIVPAMHRTAPFNSQLEEYGGSALNQGSEIVA